MSMNDTAIVNVPVRCIGSACINCPELDITKAYDTVEPKSFIMVFACKNLYYCEHAATVMKEEEIKNRKKNRVPNGT